MGSEASFAVAKAYLIAKVSILEAGYFDEIEAQRRLKVSDVSEPLLLSEGAWVILSAGMSELVIRRKFGGISAAFLNWRSARAIRAQSNQCCREALTVFNSERKIAAIAAFVSAVARDRFVTARARLVAEGVSYIATLPGLGEVSRIHLAKNLGLDVAKPDRHLCRLAAVCGYSDPTALCKDIATLTTDRVSVVDSVLWRYATLNRNYEDHFRHAVRPTA